METFEKRGRLKFEEASDMDNELVIDTNFIGSSQNRYVHNHFPPGDPSSNPDGDKEKIFFFHFSQCRNTQNDFSVSLILREINFCNNLVSKLPI